MESLVLFSLAIRVFLSLLLVGAAVFLLWRALSLIIVGHAGERQTMSLKLGGFEANATGSSVLLLLTALPLVAFAQITLPAVSYDANVRTSPSLNGAAKLPAQSGGADFAEKCDPAKKAKFLVESFKDKSLTDEELEAGINMVLQEHTVCVVDFVGSGSFERSLRYRGFPVDETSDPLKRE